MALARARRADRRIDYWPGFVDALSTLLLAIMFLLSVFVLAQFLLSREISGKRRGADAPRTRQINELTAAAGAGAAAARRTRRIASPTCRPRCRPRRAERRRLRAAARRKAPAPTPAASAIGAADRGELDERAADQPAGAEPGRAAQPADRGAAQPDRRARGGARGVRSTRTASPTPRSPISAAA